MTLCRPTCVSIGTDFPPHRAVSCLTTIWHPLSGQCSIGLSSPQHHCFSRSKAKHRRACGQMLRMFFKGKDEVDKIPSRGKGSENPQLGLYWLLQCMKTILQIHLPPWPAPKGHHALHIFYLPTSKQGPAYPPQQCQMRPHIHLFDSLSYQQELTAWKCLLLAWRREGNKQVVVCGMTWPGQQANLHRQFLLKDNYHPGSAKHSTLTIRQPAPRAVSSMPASLRKILRTSTKSHKQVSRSVTEGGTDLL